MSENVLYENSFKITEINADKYERVSRLKGVVEHSNDTDFMLDFNRELFDLQIDERITVALALSLNPDGSKDDKGWRNVSRGDATLADEYDYVCHGKIYRFEEGEGANIRVYASFGGLLMFMDGPYNSLAALRVDHVYLLLKK